MKSRVNLYLPEYQPKLELFTLGALLFLFGVLLALLIIARVTLSINGANAEQRLTSIKSDLEQQTEFVEVLTDQLQRRKEDPQLLAIFAGLQSSLQNKERLKQALSDREALKSTSFALMLRELSEQHEEDLWLTQISVNEDSMVFAGEIIKPEAVPQWVGRLGATEYFSGKEFDEAHLFRKDSALHFSLTTTRAGEEASSEGGTR